MIELEGGVCAPIGYSACGLRAGIKPGKTNRDMALVLSSAPATCAGTFTRNKVKAAPVRWDQEIVEGGGSVRAVIVNTGYANAATGALGYDNCVKTAHLTADLLGVTPQEVFVASTGIIGQQLPMDAIAHGAEQLAQSLASTSEAAHNAAEAIMTTDTRPKEYALQFTIGGKTVTMGGMCKGSGMIHPNMGTMIGIITCDCAIDRALLLRAQREIVEDTFNMVSVDGDTSTNDSVLVLCNGLAGNAPIQAEGDDYRTFYEALFQMNRFLAMRIAEDGEGATKLFEVTVVGARSKEDAKLLSKSVACSNLTKAAMFGKDANWGRILCAMGYSGAEFDPERVDLTFRSAAGELLIARDSVATDYSEEKATEILSAPHVTAILDVKDGDATATAWGCDLTFDYVSINADYRS